MATHQSKVPSDEVVKRDFQWGTVQPGPGMAPEQEPAEDEQIVAKENAAAAQKDQGKPASGGCGCG